MHCKPKIAANVLDFLVGEKLVALWENSLRTDRRQLHSSYSFSEISYREYAIMIRDEMVSNGTFNPLSSFFMSLCSIKNAEMVFSIRSSSTAPQMRAAPQSDSLLESAHETGI